MQSPNGPYIIVRSRCLVCSAREGHDSAQHEIKRSAGWVAHPFHQCGQAGLERSHWQDRYTDIITAGIINVDCEAATVLD